MADFITQQTRRSVQSEVKPISESSVGVGVLYWMAAGGSLISPWWSTTRDYQLRAFAKQSDHFQGSVWMVSAKLTSVPFRIEPRDTAIASHWKQASYYQTLLTEQIQFGSGWQAFWARFWYDAWTQDNGAFAEVIGGGAPNGRLRGPVFGLAHLDSAKCSRTSNPEYPVIYDDPRSGRHRFHYSRIIFTSQQPSPQAEMYNVGHCWLTRALHAVQNLIDIAVYKEEKLGSRPPRQMLLGKGVDTDTLLSALRMSADRMDSENLARFAKTVVVGSVNPDFDVTQLDLASAPDGFEDRTSQELGMALIALAGGFPVRWFWPATQSGATIADAMFSHISGSGGGAAWHLEQMQTLIGGSERGEAHVSGKILPPHLRIVFDYQDDQQDKQQADIRKTRSDRRKTDVEAGIIDVRVARQQAMSDGDLTEAQYEQLELQDGRLPNGNDVLSLFESKDPYFVKMLDLGLGDSPLLVALHDPVDAVIAIDAKAIDAQASLVNARSRKEQEKAEQALSALGKLKSIYEPLLVEQFMTEEGIGEEGEPGQSAETGGGPEDVSDQETTEETETEPAAGKTETEDGEVEESPEDEDEEEVDEEEEEEPDEEEVEKAITTYWTLKDFSDLPDDALIDVVLKQFNFGARVGEVIRGQLARGRGGRFVNAAQLEGMRSEMIRGILAKIRGKMTGGGAKGGAAAAKKAENRAKAEGALEGRGVPKGSLDTMDAIKRGDQPDAKAVAELEKRGLVKRLPDGTPSLTTEGRSVMSGADSGDIDKINSSLADAAEKLSKPPKGGKGGGGGGKKKPTPEEEAEKKRKLEEQRKRKKAEETSQKIKDTMSEIADEFGVDQEDIDLFARFTGGDQMIDPDTGEVGSRLEDMPGDVARRLATAGLVRFDADGKILTTVSGRIAFNAAKTGNAARARDAMSRAQQKVAKTREKIADRYDRISEQNEKIREIGTAGQERAEDDAEYVAERRETIADSNRKIADSEDKISELEGKLADLETDPLYDRDPNKRVQAMQRVESAIVSEKKKAERERDRVKNEQEKITDREKNAKKAQAAIAERLEREQERIAEIQVEIDGLSASIGIPAGEEVKAIGDMARGVRGAITGLWRGATDEFSFVDSMVSVIRRGLRDAWIKGASECGIKEDEITEDEWRALEVMTNQEYLYLGSFATDIAAVRDIHAESPRDVSGQLGPLLNRGEMWVNRYETARTMGKAMACANKKMEWVLGEADHCSSCLKLEGKVKRASYWVEKGILPRVPGASYLDCAGFNCACELKETDAPASKGPLPSLP